MTVKMSLSRRVLITMHMCRSLLRGLEDMAFIFPQQQERGQRSNAMTSEYTCAIE